MLDYLVDHGVFVVGFAIFIAAIGSFMTADSMKRISNGELKANANWFFVVAAVFSTTSWAFQMLIAVYVTSDQVQFSMLPASLGLVSLLAFSVTGLVIVNRGEKQLNLIIGSVCMAVGTITSYIQVRASMGSDVKFPTNLDSNSAYYIIPIVCCVAAVSDAMRSKRHHSPIFASFLFLTASMIYIGLFSELSIFATAQEGASADAVIVFVCVMALIVVGIALAFASVNKQNQIDAVQSIQKSASMDVLTGLPNRHALKAHISDLAKTSDKLTCKFTVLTINMNRFRSVNEAHGSEAGDFILTTISQRLAASMDDGEFVARVSGDEFYAVKANIFRRSDAEEFADKVLEIIGETMVWNMTKFDMSASIGGAIFPVDGETTEELIRHSNTAMFRAKLSKAAEPVFFDAEIDRVNRDLSALSIEMRKAIDEGEFEIYYQPQNSAVDGRLVGFEALLRWNHPTRGMVSPAHFIPLAEETGMITEIGAWVLRESCMHAASWDSNLTVSVNVSSIQIMRNNLPLIVSEALRNSGISPSRLELEITESGLVGDEDHALRILGDLKAMGCSIAMDDFGTGYSSLSSFKRFPFDKIKIDRAFIMDLQTNNQSLAIVNATIAVGRTLNIKILAEGVEDEDQLMILKAAGCNEVQGYFFGRPVPLSEVEGIIVNSRTTISPSKPVLYSLKSA